MKKNKKNLPGGLVLDVFNRTTRCLMHACAVTDMDPFYDSHVSFDTHYGSVKPNEKIILTVCVRLDKDGLAEAFYKALDSTVFNQYGIKATLNSEVELPTHVFGNAFSAANESINALWRCYTLERDDDCDMDS